MSAPYLRPYAHVAATPNGYMALTADPWLVLDLPRAMRGGHWMRFSYRSSYLDPLIRPLIRFEGPSEPEWDVMRAPIFGRATWIGRIPEGTRRILISPVNEAGPFSFEIEAMRRIVAVGLLARALRRDRKTAAMAVGARLINARRETRQALMFSRGGIPLCEYEHWKQHGTRDFAPLGIDKQRRPNHDLPHVRFVLERLTEEIQGSNLWRSLIQSGHLNWSLLVLNNRAAPEGPPDRRLIWDSGQASISRMTQDLAPDDLVIFAGSQMELFPWTLSCLSEFAARRPDADIIYGDHQELAPDGKLWPVLKPDWSPRLQASVNYVGQALWLRMRTLRDATRKDHFSPHAILSSSLLRTMPGRVAHLRRLLVSLPQSTLKKSIHIVRTSAQDKQAVSVSVIIPNKNQLKLIRNSLDGVLYGTSYADVEIIVVDNDSGPRTTSFYRTLPPAVHVLHAPGPFNFSSMCNQAARQAHGTCLVFLNNDIEVIDPDWLTHLVNEAQQPDIGAVGARLLFPSGRIQHAGVTIGMGGFADHAYQGLWAHEDTYRGKLDATHEVSAVTGACLAVTAEKFWAVNGFDAENFPVELNDIDLCLKLGAKGWQTLICPAAKLVHHQSATRGFSFRPFTRYGKERAAFRKKWATVVRDDPFFHPALSLFSVIPALDG